MLTSSVFQPPLNKEGSEVPAPSHPPSTAAEQRLQNPSPVQKSRDSPPPSPPPPLSPPSRGTESEVESLLVEPQTGLPGDTQYSNSFIGCHFTDHQGP